MDGRPATDIPAALSRVLDPDERVCWWGRPYPGPVFCLRDIFLIPFGLFFASNAVAMPGVIIAKAQSPTELWPFFMMPVFAGVAWLTAGRFLSDMRRRRRLVYAVTSTRVIIASDSRVTSVIPSRLSEIGLEEESRGYGSILFGHAGGEPLRSFIAWSIEPTVPALEKIEGARAVFDLIRSLKGR